MIKHEEECLYFPFISTLQSAAFWNCNSGLHSQLSLRWFVLCKIANSVAISFTRWNKGNLLLFKLGLKTKFTQFLYSSRLSFRGFKWCNCIVFGPTTSPTEKNNLQSEYFSASCKAHCSVSWEKKKVKLFLYLWTVVHCCTGFLSFCTNLNCTKSRESWLPHP